MPNLNDSLEVMEEDSEVTEASEVTEVTGEGSVAKVDSDSVSGDRTRSREQKSDEMKTYITVKEIM